MSTRITSEDVWQKFGQLAHLMATEFGMEQPVLYLGSVEHKITNKLIFNKSNLWPDGMAGTSKRDAYRALQVMIAGMGAAAMHAENMRRARARTGL